MAQCSTKVMIIPMPAAQFTETVLKKVLFELTWRNFEIEGPSVTAQNVDGLHRFSAVATCIPLGDESRLVLTVCEHDNAADKTLAKLKCEALANHLQEKFQSQ